MTVVPLLLDTHADLCQAGGGLLSGWYLCCNETPSDRLWRAQIRGVTQRKGHMTGQDHRIIQQLGARYWRLQDQGMNERSNFYSTSLLGTAELKGASHSMSIVRKSTDVFSEHSRSWMSMEDRTGQRDEFSVSFEEESWNLGLQCQRKGVPQMQGTKVKSSWSGHGSNPRNSQIVCSGLIWVCDWVCSPRQ